MAGWLWQTGEAALVYAARRGFFGGAALDWTPAFAALGLPADIEVYPNIYPPIWAVLTAP